MPHTKKKIAAAAFREPIRSLSNNYKSYFVPYSDPLPTDTKWAGVMLERFLSPLKALLEAAIDLNQLQSLDDMGGIYVLNEKLEHLSHLFTQEDPDRNLISDCLSEINSWYLHRLPDLERQVKEIQNDTNKTTKRLITKQLISTKSEYLYHGVKFEYIKDILTRKSILGYTTQRFWDDGKRFKETDPEYQDSYWMKGISMSRDLDYALSFGSVLLIFDRTKIKQKHSVEPYSWNFHFGADLGTTHPKKEREDFVVLSKKKKRFKNKDNDQWMKEYHDVMNHDLSYLDEEEKTEYETFKKKMTLEKEKLDLSEMDKPEGEFDFSENEALVGIVIRQHILEIHGLEDDTVEMILSHPLFMGVLK